LFDTVRVADYLLDKDKLFAQLTLDEEEFGLYEQVYARLAVDAPAPDLVIYLQAPVDVLRERIERRGIKYEQNIERNYLERLQETYARFFHAYDASPLLIVNAAQADFVNNDHDYGQLLEQVVRTRRGRHYYNPLKSAV
jgi:deoxyguanosine kinase